MEAEKQGLHNYFTEKQVLPMGGPATAESLPPPFMGEVARWIRAKPGAAGSEGCPFFKEKWAPPS